MLDYRIMLGFPNQIDKAVCSGGSWVTSLPLANIQNRLFARVARSTDAAPGSTTMVLDYGRPVRMQILALIAHNISLGGKVRFEASAKPDLSSPLYDKTVDVWGGLITAPWDLDALEWEDDNFWLGGFSQDDIAGLTATSAHIMDAPISARYWRITIMDEGNTDSFVQIGRVFMGPVLQPRINYAWGAGLGYETLTEVVTALSGAEFFDVREPVRVFRFSLQYLQDDQGYGQFLEMTRKAGIHGEIFVVPDPSDPYFGLLRNFMGRIRQPSVLEQATWANGGSAHNMSFEIKELR